MSSLLALDQYWSLAEFGNYKNGTDGIGNYPVVLFKMFDSASGSSPNADRPFKLIDTVELSDSPVSLFSSKRLLRFSLGMTIFPSDGTC